jgi:hypothetical protein
MHSSRLFYNPNIPAISEDWDGYSSSSSSEDMSDEKDDIPKVLLPLVIAVYPHQPRNDHPTLPDMKQFNGFMSNNPNQEEFNRIVKSDVDKPHAKLFLSNRMTRCLINFSQDPFIPYDWVDFALLYSPNDLANLKHYSEMRMTPAGIRNDNPLLFKFGVSKKGELKLKAFDGQFHLQNYIYWGDREISKKIKKSLFIFTRLSQNFLHQQQAHQQTLAPLIRL